MKKMLQLPQEIEVWYIIPAIRRELAKGLKKIHFKQKDIARVLGVTEAAVSQYLSSKRGGKLVFNDKFLEKINESCQEIKNDKSSSQEAIYKLTKYAKETGKVCEIHKAESCVDKNCDICFRGEKA